MQTNTIRVSPSEKNKITKALKQRGLSINATCKLIAYRTIKMGYYPSFKQPISRARRGQRTELIHFKLDKEVIHELSKIRKETKIPTSTLFREYLQNPDKLFEKPRSAFQRRSNTEPRDFYQTPRVLTERFLNAYDIPRTCSILEPAAGENAIVNVLKERFDKVTYFDKFVGDNPRCFFDYTEKHDVVMTNPPWRDALDFILHSMGIADKSIHLLPLDYLHSSSRYKAIYNNENLDWGLEGTWVFNRQPMLSTEPQNGDRLTLGTGQVSVAWFVFAKKNKLTTPPQIHFIDINDCV